MDSKIIEMLLQKLVDRADEVDSDEAYKGWEGSPADEAADKRNAKKAGKSVSEWEGSPGDVADDAKHERAGFQAKDNSSMEDVGDDEDESLKLLELFK